MIPNGTVDVTNQALGTSCLRDPITGDLLIAYMDTSPSMQLFVRLARWNGSAWSTQTLYTGYYLDRNGAVIDAMGAIHMAIYNGTSTFYVTNRSGAWSTPQLIPGLGQYGATIDVDAARNVHITSVMGSLGNRYYATNASGSWVVSTVATSSTGPAAILAAGVPAPTMTHAHWANHIIYHATSPNWTTGQSLFNYFADQGPPQALQVFGGTLQFAYYITTDIYTTYEIHFQTMPSGGSWTAPQTLATRTGQLHGMELTLESSGRRSVVFCNGSGGVEVVSDHSGSWRTSNIPGPNCEWAVDAIFYGSRLYAAYREGGATTPPAGRLTITSVDVGGL